MANINPKLFVFIDIAPLLLILTALTIYFEVKKTPMKRRMVPNSIAGVIGFVWALWWIIKSWLMLLIASLIMFALLIGIQKSLLSLNKAIYQDNKNKSKS